MDIVQFAFCQIPIYPIRLTYIFIKICGTVLKDHEDVMVRKDDLVQSANVGMVEVFERLNLDMDSWEFFLQRKLREFRNY